MVLGGRFRGVPAATVLTVLTSVPSNDGVGAPVESIGSTCDVVNACVRASRSILLLIWSRYPSLLGQIWCCWLPSELCWPRPGPGGFFQEVYTLLATGANAFGTGSGSLKGDRISGLVGNSSR